VAGVRHVFASVASPEGGDFQQQARDALDAVETLAREEGVWGSIVSQAVFLGDVRQIETCRQIMRDFYGEHLPAISYVPQTPCGGQSLAIEIFGIDATRGEAEIRRLSERTVTVRHHGATWAHCANVLPQTAQKTVYVRSLDAFHRMERELAAWGFNFDQVVRTWLYIGDIVGVEDNAPRYQHLNQARTDFYRGHRFVGNGLPADADRVCYPASTGIGADNRDVMMSCLALATDRAEVVRLPLENPRQVAAHDYDHRYGAKSPKFTRAMAICDRGAATVLVSGTASILDSESHHLDDVAKQTRETLDNIAALIGEDNFRRHGQAGLGATLDDLAIVRAYIKRPEDYDVVLDACRARLGQTPIIATVSDMCRPELLVEIEGIAFCGGA
jgi:enamine deaminase RidA (YjgF/YER057c/UK114 family)